MLAGRRTYIDPLLRAVRKRADEFTGLGYHFYDINGKMNTQLTDRDNLMVSFYGGEDDLNQPFKKETIDYLLVCCGVIKP